MLDPTQIGRFRPVPVVNVILDSLDVADEEEQVYAGAEDPLPEDVKDFGQDYIFGIGDIIRISIYELRREGVTFTNDYRVSETGRITIPEVGQVQALGLTESKLEEEIEDRFGKIDINTKQFLQLIMIKIKALKKSIKTISNYEQNISFTFDDGHKDMVKSKSRDDDDIIFAVSKYLG